MEGTIMMMMIMMSLFIANFLFAFSFSFCCLLLCLIMEKSITNFQWEFITLLYFLFSIHSFFNLKMKNENMENSK